ncbi:MAG: DUF3422 domain-containing protein [Henriciella sp.]|uniref:DUF3422 family protein n=1 Tax=Henriciella sp. TaxID=1968823 RepID=UPI003C75EB1F
MVELPQEHPKRVELSNEVHARPPHPVTAPAKISCIALTTERPFHDDDRAYVEKLTKRFGAPAPEPGKKYHKVDMDGVTLVWEHHTEFMRYTVIIEGDAKPYKTALEALPNDWLTKMPGQLISAVHLDLVRASDREEMISEAKAYFPSQSLIGAEVAGGLGLVATDFRLHDDGFSRYIVLDKGMSDAHFGRTIQRLLDIETYRVMALLALPMAQDLILKLSGWEYGLSQITSEMSDPELDNDTDLLEQLTTLQAAIELGYAQSQFRFGAASAYYALVQRRTSELRESRVTDMQTFAEFIERRLAPAMRTSSSVEGRMQTLSQRVDRATQLLSTKVNISLEQQNQRLMESMDKRAALQLRLQQTVEGLSIAAISYYLIGLVNYVAEAIAYGSPGTNPKLITGIAVPFVLGLTAFGVWRMRKHIEKENPPADRD